MFYQIVFTIFPSHVLAFIDLSKITKHFTDICSIFASFFKDELHTFFGILADYLIVTENGFTTFFFSCFSLNDLPVSV